MELTYGAPLSPAPVLSNLSRVRCGYRPSAPKADALPGCATPRPAELRRFPDDSAQAETRVRGNGGKHKARTGASCPEQSPNRSARHG